MLVAIRISVRSLAAWKLAAQRESGCPSLASPRLPALSNGTTHRWFFLDAPKRLIFWSPILWDTYIPVLTRRFIGTGMKSTNRNPFISVHRFSYILASSFFYQFFVQRNSLSILSILRPSIFSTSNVTESISFKFLKRAVNSVSPVSVHQI